MDGAVHSHVVSHNSLRGEVVNSIYRDFRISARCSFPRHILTVCLLVVGMSFSIVSDAKDITGTLRHGNFDRSYLLHLPPTMSTTTKLPAVFVFHGGFGGPSHVASQTKFNLLANEEGFIVVYPEGIDKHWNDGRIPTPTGMDNDVDFISSLIDHLQSQYPIDTKRIYATGISNGGFLTQRLACELNDKIVAFAAVSSSIPLPLKSICDPSRPVSIMMINGTDDKLVPWQGGSMTFSEAKGGLGGEILSVPAAIEFWRSNAQCQDRQVIRPTDLDPNDGTLIERTDYTDCESNILVSLVAIKGGGHTWPGSESRRLFQRVVGRTSKDINASRLIWDFFKGQNF